MSNFNNKSITNKGLELLSAAMAGSKLEFTRIVMGSGTYSGDIGVIESLVNQNQSLDIKSITRKGSQVILSTTLLQSAIAEDFYWKEIGVYAKGSDGVEVLYMYGSAIDTSFISKDMLNEKMINVGVLVSNAQNITATIDGSLVYLSKSDLEDHDNNETAHSSLRKWVQGLFDSLKLTWDSIIGKPSVFPPESHNHDDRYYTESEMDKKLNGKANSSHTHDDATTSASGYMSASDKTKLNGVATGATKNTVENLLTSSSTTNALSAYQGNILNQAIESLKSTVVNGKTSVANAINGHLGTTLSNQTSFDDFAYYIIHKLIKKPVLKSSFIVNYPGTGKPVTLVNTTVAAFYSMNGCTVTCDNNCYVYKTGNYAAGKRSGDKVSPNVTSSTFKYIGTLIIICEAPSTITLTPSSSSTVSAYTLL